MDAGCTVCPDRECDEDDGHESMSDPGRLWRPRSAFTRQARWRGVHADEHRHGDACTGVNAGAAMAFGHPSPPKQWASPLQGDASARRTRPHAPCSASTAYPTQTRVASCGPGDHFSALARGWCDSEGGLATPKQASKRTITPHAAHWQPVRSDGEPVAHAAPDDCPAVPPSAPVHASARAVCRVKDLCNTVGWEKPTVRVGESQIAS
jgi:hypothetical protein